MMTFEGVVSPTLLAAIVDSLEAAPLVTRLAKRMAIGPEALERLIIEAFDAGEVEPCRAPRTGSDAVTLTPLAAERLGVRLNRIGSRWVSRKTPEPADRKKIGPDTITIGETDSAFVTGSDTGLDDFDVSPKILDRLPDPKALEAWELAAIAESTPRRSFGKRCQNGPAEHDIPLPTVFLGERLQYPAVPLVEFEVWWPVTKVVDGKRKNVLERFIYKTEGRPPHCPGCRDHPRPHEYCLICDRYGRGWMLPKVKVERRRQLEPPKAKLRAQRRAEKFASKPQP
jgi:hypothetical protein